MSGLAMTTLAQSWEGAPDPSHPGISTPRKRRAAKHRSRRQRREAEGMMLQVDGSPHDWLEGRGPRLCLIRAIDDASGKVSAAFFAEAESPWA